MASLLRSGVPKTGGDVDWENIFAAWAQSPSKTEQTRCENAVNAIRNAIGKSAALKHRSIKVFTQGSYRNRVNVKQDSDVDIGVLCDESYFYSVPTGMTAEQVGNYDGPGTYLYSVFKNELEAALVAHFGRTAVVRGNKALNIRETTYHVEADVVPLFEYRTYSKTGGHIAGVALLQDKGGRIENFPERLLSSWPNIPLHYENGVSKNDGTGRRYKSVVRIIKKLRNIMEEAGNAEAKLIPSYLIECLVWNVSDVNFNGKPWLEIVRSVLCSIWSATKDDASCGKWCEVDDIKFLFHSSQPWTRQQAHDFVGKAWDLIGIS